MIPLALIFAALQIADVASTLAALKRGALEANPILAGAIRRGLSPLATMVVAKVITILAFILLGVFFGGSAWLLVGLNVVYVLVVIHNIRQIRTHGKRLAHAGN